MNKTGFRKGILKGGGSTGANGNSCGRGGRTFFLDQTRQYSSAVIFVSNTLVFEPHTKLLRLLVFPCFHSSPPFPFPLLESNLTKSRPNFVP